MGCISSKIMARSTSFQEELSQRLQTRGHKDFPVLEEILISRNAYGGDHQLLALVCTPNTVSKKLPSKSVASTSSVSSSSDIKTCEQGLKVETINTWQLMHDLDEEEESLKGFTDVSRRSKSFHLASDHQELPLEEQNVISRSRSFHTVQEFDAMMLTKESNDKPRKSQTGTGDVVLATDNGIRRRRSIAKELKPIAIPSTIEFPVIESLNENMELYSGGAYVTPKFGSFGLPVSTNTNTCIETEGSEFEPDLVSAFEEDMQQLKLEEEFVLQQIAEELEEKKEANELVQVGLET